jgi:hypothetical protein
LCCRTIILAAPASSPGLTVSRPHGLTAPRPTYH